VLDIGKRQKATLGFLPDSAFGDRARAGRLLIAIQKDRVMGYCLFDLPRSGQIKLRHVCVDPGARGLDLGRRMLDRIAELHPGATGMIADCRKDYGLEGFWTRAGFSPRSERKGRALGGSVLVVWWRQLSSMDLFDSAMAIDSGGIAVLDTNVVSDLYSSELSTRVHRELAEAVAATALEASMILAVSPQADLELSRIQDAENRSSQQNRSQELFRLRRLPSAKELRSRLENVIGRARIDKDPSLLDDVVHIADAIANDAKFFVTNDEPLLKHAAKLISAEFGFDVVRPHQFVERVFEKSNSPIYESRLIETLNLSWRPTKLFEEAKLEETFLLHGRERASDFRRLLRAAVARDPANATVLQDDKGEIWALLATASLGSALTVDLLRTRAGRRSTTLTSQIARLLRSRAVAIGASDITVRAGAVSDHGARLLIDDGFLQAGNDLTAVAQAGFIDLADASQRWGARGELTPLEVAEAERLHWPLTVVGAGLPVYVIPIQPRYAAHLFGLSDGPGLFDIGSADLGLSRENVYYSGSTMNLPAGPARILWYVSHDKTRTVRSIAAHSRLIESARLSPDEAFGRFRHLGILDRRAVRGVAAKDGKVHVVRFEDTLLLANPIDRAEMATMFELRGTTTHLPSIRAASTSLFDDVVMRESPSR
jgi:GNAT superfamily N-acetyltransferase/predicted nucleic acid-binding protein